MTVHGSHRMQPYGPNMAIECYACGANMRDIYGTYVLKYPCNKAEFGLLRFMEIMIEKNG